MSRRNIFWSIHDKKTRSGYDKRIALANSNKLTDKISSRASNGAGEHLTGNAAGATRVAGAGDDDAFGAACIVKARVHRLGGNKLRLSGGENGTAITETFEAAATGGQSDRDESHRKEGKTLFHGGDS